ncbi:hypothetical protein I9P32_02380 [Campylobacter peloridis]|nr:hypothetical protein [Campylobacter peloridis]
MEINLTAINSDFSILIKIHSFIKQTKHKFHVLLLIVLYKAKTNSYKFIKDNIF